MTKVVVHEGADTGTGIFYKRGYEEETIIPYSLGTYCHP